MAIPQLPRQPVPTLDNNKQCISCSIPISHSLAPSLLPHRPNRSLTWVPNVMWHHILHLHLGCLTTHQVLPALYILIHHSDSCRGHRARHIRRAAETAAERSKHRHGQGHQHVRLPSGLQYHSPLQRVEGTPGCSPYPPQPGTYNCHHLPRVGLGRDHSGLSPSRAHQRAMLHPCLGHHRAATKPSQSTRVCKQLCVSALQGARTKLGRPGALPMAGRASCVTPAWQEGTPSAGHRDAQQQHSRAAHSGHSRAAGGGCWIHGTHLYSSCCPKSSVSSRSEALSMHQGRASGDTHQCHTAGRSAAWATA